MGGEEIGVKGNHSHRGGRPGGMGRKVTGVLTAALAALLLAATAQAAPPVTIAGLGQGAGQVDNPEGVAVDQASGDLYVADRNNFRIDKFDSAGEFALAWGYGVRDGTTMVLQTCGPEANPPTKRCFNATAASGGANSATGPGAVAPHGVAVDQSSHAVYVADTINRRVSKFSPTGEFLFMVGKGVNQGGGTPSTPGNLCTAQHLADGDVCGAGLSASGAGQFFANPQSLAIDASGHLWVGEIDRVIQFDQDGTYLSEAALPGGGVTRAFGIDPVSGDFYLRSESLSGARRYTPSGSPVDTLTLIDTLDAAGAPEALAVDGSGNLFIGDCDRTSGSVCPSPYRLKIFNPAGEQVSQFGAGQIPAMGGATFPTGNALATDDSAKALYLSNPFPFAQTVRRFTIPEPGPLPDNQRAEDIEPTTVTLAAGLNPEGNQTTYRFEYGTTDSYGLSTEAKTLPGTGFDDEEVKAGLTELIPGTTYHFRLVATNHCKPAEPSVECTVAGDDTTFTTLPAVGIEAQWATNVSAGDATLHAELDPLGVAGSWWIEYGTSPCSGGGCEETAESALPASFGAIPVATAFSGLEPSTTYHYRFAARDERDGAEYTVHGEDRSFTTQLTGLGFALADDRAWEMVSPPNKFGGRIGVESHGEGQIQAAADGNALAYLSLGSIEADPEGNRVIEDSSVLARRGGPGSWTSKDVTPPNTGVTPLSVGYGREYKLFSPDLESALLEPRSGTPLSPIATERTPYLRENTDPHKYTPLLTGKEGFANVSPGTVFGGDLTEVNPAVHVTGASAELEHVVLRSDVPLAAGAVAEGLYEWLAGRPPEEQLLPVSRLPAGNLVAGELGSGLHSVRRAISADGSRIFWSTFNAGFPNALYLRDTELEETIRLDVVQPGATGSGLARPIFQGADAEGTVAFFTDTRQLTEDSGASFLEAGKSKSDLYRCEIVREAGEDKCLLENLTPEGDGGKAAEVLGLAPGIGEDGSHVYFFARGVLDPLPNARGEGAVAGRPNLYLWREGEGTRFVATLAEGDEHAWGAPAPGVAPAAFILSAAASPSGRYLAFMSERPLTGYDNRDADSGEPAQEVFRFDAQANGGDGGLICASCNPAGARPAARLPSPDEATLLGFDPLHLWNGRVLAATLPGATRTNLSGVSLYRSRSVHDNGRVFFNAFDSLAPADSNGDWDVYEYEPSGVGDCGPSSGSAGVSISAGGCVALISSGTAEGESAFLDASVGGDDVFFLTKAPLSVLDEDNVTDVYDARVGGTTATLVPRAECLGEACQPAARAPDDPTPASAAFKGAGNVPPVARKRCPRSKRRVTRKGKSRCVVRKQNRKREAKR